jgi:hypothetical protein
MTNRTAITEPMAYRAVQLLVPCARSKLAYRIAWDDFLLIVTRGEEFTRISLQPNQLLLSIDDFSDLVRSKLPPEWLTVPA